MPEKLPHRRGIPARIPLTIGALLETPGCGWSIKSLGIVLVEMAAMSTSARGRTAKPYGSQRTGASGVIIPAFRHGFVPRCSFSAKSIADQ